MSIIGKEFYRETENGVGIYYTPVEYIQEKKKSYICERIRDDAMLLFECYASEEELLKMEEVEQWRSL